MKNLYISSATASLKQSFKFIWQERPHNLKELRTESTKGIPDCCNSNKMEASSKKVMECRRAGDEESAKRGREAAVMIDNILKDTPPIIIYDKQGVMIKKINTN